MIQHSKYTRYRYWLQIFNVKARGCYDGSEIALTGQEILSINTAISSDQVSYSKIMVR